MFLETGAAGVLATAAPIESDFAHQVARGLFERLRPDPGLPVAAAVRDLRREAVDSLPKGIWRTDISPRQLEAANATVQPVLYWFMYLLRLAPHGSLIRPRRRSPGKQLTTMSAGVNGDPGTDDDHGLQLQPTVSWPRVMTVGRQYLVEVDLNLVTEDGTPPVVWPFDHEEYAYTCLLNGGEDFGLWAVHDASVVVHRFGGSYGPAQFVVTAKASKATDGTPRVPVPPPDDPQPVGRPHQHLRA